MSRAARSRSQPRMPVPMETKRILRSVEGGVCAGRVGGVRMVAFRAEAAAAAPAPRRTKSRLLIEKRFTGSLLFESHSRSRAFAVSIERRAHGLPKVAEV